MKYKEKLKSTDFSDQQNFILGIDYRIQTDRETLLKTPKKGLKEACRRKNLPVGGNKDVLIERLLRAKEDEVEDFDPEWLNLMQKSKPELQKLCCECGILIRSRDNKTTLIERILHYRDDQQNIIEEEAMETPDMEISSDLVDSDNSLDSSSDSTNSSDTDSN